METKPEKFYLVTSGDMHEIFITANGVLGIDHYRTYSYVKAVTKRAALKKSFKDPKILVWINYCKMQAGNPYTEMSVTEISEEEYNSYVKSEELYGKE